MKIERLTIIATGCALLIACTTTSKSLDYLPDYKSAVQPQVTDLSGLEHTGKFVNLIGLFSDLKNADVVQRIENTYSENLYFNDTLHTFTERGSLIKYLLDSAEAVDDISVEFEDIASSGENHYLRWVMRMKFKVLGKSVETQSIGISQIRFDEHGKVVFHQDFWDNTTGLFGHLPVLGGVLNKIKTSMKN